MRCAAPARWQSERPDAEPRGARHEALPTWPRLGRPRPAVAVAACDVACLGARPAASPSPGPTQFVRQAQRPPWPPIPRRSTASAPSATSSRSATSAPGPPGSEANTQQREMVAAALQGAWAATVTRAAVHGPRPADRRAGRDGQPDRLVVSPSATSASSSAPTTTPGPTPTRSPTRPARAAVPRRQRRRLGRRPADGDRPPPEASCRPPGASTSSSSTARNWSTAPPDRGRVLPRLQGVRPRLRAGAAAARRTRTATSPGSCSTWSAASDLTIDQEPNSLNLAPSLVRDVWAVARQLNAPAFRNARRPGGARRPPRR